MKRFTCMLAGAGLLASLVVLGTANAEIRPSDLNHPPKSDSLGPGYGSNETQWSLVLSSFFDSTDTLDTQHFSPLLKIAAPFGANDFEATVGAFLHRVIDDEGSIGLTHLSNLYLGHYWAWRTLKQQVRLGLAVALPTATLPSKSVETTLVAVSGFETASGIRGFQDLWLWMPNTFTVNGSLDAYFRFSSGFIAGGRVTAGWMTKIDATPLVDEESLILQGELDLIYDTEPARFQLLTTVVNVPVPNLDSTRQTTLVPQTRIRLGLVDLLLGLSLPVDGPAGPAYDTHKAWAFRVGIANATTRHLPEK